MKESEDFSPEVQLLARALYIVMRHTSPNNLAPALQEARERAETWPAEWSDVEPFLNEVYGHDGVHVMDAATDRSAWFSLDNKEG